MQKLCRALGKKNAIILMELLEKRQEIHFNELTRVLETDPKTISRRLNEQMELGLIRKRIEGINSYYSLSEKGSKVLSILEQLKSLDRRLKS